MRTRWIPKDGAPVESPHGVAYLYSLANNRLAAVAYRGKSGKSAKSSWHHSFRTREELDKYVSEWFAGLAESAKMKADRATARRTFRPTLKIGDILEGSWGYDQTNPEFFQVVEVHGKHVILRELCTDVVPKSGGFMSDRRKPVKDRFTDKEPIRRLVQEGNNVKLFDFGCYLSPWDGGEAYCSWYA